MYFQLQFGIDRIKELAPQHAEYKEMVYQPRRVMIAFAGEVAILRCSPSGQT